MKAMIRAHPSASYFTLAFALAWGGILAVIGAGPIPAPPEDSQRLFTFVYLAMLAGPSIAGILLISIVDGTPGLRELGTRLMKWRVGLRWYAIALLTAPLAFAFTLIILTQFSADFIPFVFREDGAVTTGAIHAENLGSYLTLGLAVGIGAGVFEEVGWTGFAIHTLRARHSVLATGLIVGILWGAWHFLAILWGSANSFGSVPIPAYMIVALFSFLPPYRVLMVRVYERTGSLLIAVLMHASLTASMLILGSPITGTSLVVHNIVFATILWCCVACIQSES
jgi:membrane protease YdiL (CAAX protease family)